MLIVLQLHAPTIVSRSTSLRFSRAYARVLMLPSLLGVKYMHLNYIIYARLAKSDLATGFNLHQIWQCSKEEVGMKMP